MGRVPDADRPSVSLIAESKTVRRDVLQVWDRNPRSIKGDRFNELKARLKRQGQIKPLLVAKDGTTVIGGNMRLRAMQELGIEEVWVSQTEAQSDKEIFDLALTDNEEFGYYEQQQVAELALELGLTPLELQSYELSLEATTSLSSILERFGPDLDIAEDEAPEVDDHNPPSSVRGEVYQLGVHRLMCGDSADEANVRTLMAGHKADLMFTDPPYNIAEKGKNAASNVKSGKAYNVIQASQWDYGFEVEPFLDTSLPHMGANASYFVCTSHFLFGDLVSWMEQHLDYSNYCVWVKPNPMPSLSKRRFTWATELLVYGTCGRHIFNFPTEGHALNWLQLQSPTHTTPHPTEKPVSVPAHYIRLASRQAEIVLDVFGGSGSTLIACEQTNRICYMMELDPKYCDVIRKRYAKHIGEEESWQEATPVVNALQVV